LLMVASLWGKAALSVVSNRQSQNHLNKGNYFNSA